MPTIYMRVLPFLLALLFGALAAADSPAPRFVNVPGAFAYQLPTGWVTITLPNSLYPTAVESPNAADPSHLKALISVNIDTDSTGLTAWCTQRMAKNMVQFTALHAKVGPLEPFVPATGADAYCAQVDLSARGRAIHYFLYFFAGDHDAKITVTCACPAADLARYAPLFAAAMKTFVAR